MLPSRIFSDADSVAALAERLSGKPIDILINNAGIFRGRGQELENLNFDDIIDSFAVNSIGPLRVTQALLPNLRAGKEKRVVSVSSRLGSIELNSGGMYAYRASKTALNQLNKSLSSELGPEGFTCLVLHPGWVQTDMGGSRATYTAEESVRGMMRVINKSTRKSNGRFMDLEGNELPW